MGITFKRIVDMTIRFFFTCLFIEIVSLIGQPGLKLSIVKDSLKLLILLLSSPECWVHSHVPLCQLYQ